MFGWHHQLDGHEFEQAPGVGDGQERLECCSPWGHKELNMTVKKAEHRRTDSLEKTLMLGKFEGRRRRG